MNKNSDFNNVEYNYSSKQFNALFNVIKVSAICFVATVIAFRGNLVYANPAGEQVVAGQAQIDRAGSTLSVNQLTDKAIINWQDFSIHHGELTKFMQPSTSSAVLNRVTGGNLSSIYGTLNANGKVFLINPNGVVVGASGVINAASFTASTLDISNDEFLNGGDLNFLGNSGAKIVQKGKINALNGDVFLIAREVENSGEIDAKYVGLAGGSHVLLKQAGEEGRLFIQPDSGDGQVFNSGTINAVTAELAAVGGNTYALAINNTGVIRATGAVKENGRVYLRAKNGKISNSGTIVAKNGDGTGGEVQILGKEIELKESSLIDASGENGGGKVLVGGDREGANPNILNSEKTTVAAGAVIIADSTHSGNAGTVVIWSDGDTEFHGYISAQALGESGDGGEVEVSGKKNLWITGLVNLTAVNGLFGNLLLDPGSILIKDGGNTNLGFNVFNDSYIAHQLALGNVTIRTSNATNGNPQDITINGDVSIAWASPTTLSLEAGRSINMQSGALIENTSLTHSGKAIVMKANELGTTSDNFIGININGATLRSRTGDIELKGQGGDTGNFNIGVQIANGAVVESVGIGSSAANISITGTGGSGDLGLYGVYISGSSATEVRTINGDISLEGQGGNGINQGNIGVLVYENGAVKSVGIGSSAGKITLIGTGGTGNEGTHGVGVIGENALISSIDGDILLKGYGGGGNGNTNTGVSIAWGGKVRSLGISHNAAKITVNGTGGTGDVQMYGIYIVGGNSGIATVNGDIILNGRGGKGVNGASGNHHGVYVNQRSILSFGKGNISITGIGGQGGGFNNGVYLSGATVKAYGSGDIDMNGVGGRGEAGGHRGIFTDTSSLVESADGDIRLVGIGGVGGSEIGRNDGVEIDEASTIHSYNGNISIIGGGGLGGFHSPGVFILNHSRVYTGGEDGDVSVRSEGKSGKSEGGNIYLYGYSDWRDNDNDNGKESGENHGVEISEYSSVYTTRGGGIRIEGRGGHGGAHNVGVYILYGAEVYTEGRDPGDIIIKGQGGSNGFVCGDRRESPSGRNYGIEIADEASVYTMGGGDIHMKGRGGFGGAHNAGIYIHNHSSVYTDGKCHLGNITMEGWGGVSPYGTNSYSPNINMMVYDDGGDYGDGYGESGENHGVEIADNSNVYSKGGDIDIEGHGGFNGGHNVGVYVHDNSNVTSSWGSRRSGDIKIKGWGGVSPYNYNYYGSNSYYPSVYSEGYDYYNRGENHGVEIANASQIKVEKGTGDIKIKGWGGFGGSHNTGVYIHDGNLRNEAVVQSFWGDVNIMGWGGFGDHDNYDYGYENGPKLYSTGYIGYGYYNGENHGVEISNNSGIYTPYGDICITGSGGFGGSHNDGVYIHGNSYVMGGSASSNITLFGRGGLSNSFGKLLQTEGFGFDLDNLWYLLMNLINTGDNNGVEIANGSSVSAYGGDINIFGFGGVGGSRNRGVYIHDYSIVENHGSSYSYGDDRSDSKINSFGYGYSGGNVNIYGQGGDSGFKDLMFYVLGMIGEYYGDGYGDRDEKSLMSSRGFSLESEIGCGDYYGLPEFLLAFGNHTGVEIASSSYVASQSGDVNITGLGGFNGSFNRGIYIHNYSNIHTDGNGDIRMFGKGGMSVLGVGHVGVQLSDIGYAVAYGDGDVCLYGEGGFSLLGMGHHGVQLGNNYGALYSYGDGDINIFGRGGFGLLGWNNGVYMTGNAQVMHYGYGDILIKGWEGIGGQGIYTRCGDNYIGKYGMPGDIRLIADTMELQDVRIEGQGNLYVMPIHNYTSIGLGDDAPGRLQLSETELGNIADGFNHIYFGRRNGGHFITLENNGSPLNFLDDVTFRGNRIDVLDPVNAESNRVTFLIGRRGDGLLNLFAPVTAGLSEAFGRRWDDTFAFGDGLGLSGMVDGRGGSDTLDYSRYTTNMMVHLVLGVATNMGGIKNIENVICGSGDDFVYTQLFPWAQYLRGGPHPNGDTLIVDFLGEAGGSPFPASIINISGYGAIDYAEFEFLNPPNVPPFDDLLKPSYDDDDRFDGLRGKKGKRQEQFNVLYAFDPNSPLQGPVHNSSFRVFAGDPSTYAMELLSNYFPY